jgi:acetylornithine deacetylase/succinyl-diaminopimelate desuccinylase-like protein
MGQSSVVLFSPIFCAAHSQDVIFLQDQAHLPDERISLVNLQKGKAVIERFLVKVAKQHST